MISKMFSQNQMTQTAPKEGDIYKTLAVFGKTFVLRYGYYEEFERAHMEPMPIYPDFLREPVYTEQGDPFVTQMQDACCHYCGLESQDRDCGSCTYYQQGEDFIGICKCQENKQHTL